MNAIRFVRALPLFVFLNTVPLPAAEVVSESFDDEGQAKFERNNGLGMTLTYVDYSNMTVGSTVQNIAEAPRRLPGSLATRGVLLKADYGAAASERIANLVMLDGPAGTRLNLTDNYRLKFDFYLRLSPSITLNATGIPSNTGTTEHLLWGAGYNAFSPMGFGTRTIVGSGIWGHLATEGGWGSTATGGDAGLWNAASTNAIGTRHFENTTDRAAYFTPAFGADASPVPHCPANQWCEADITVRTGQITVEYGAVGRAKTKFYDSVVAAAVGGSVMVGYEDRFTSSSFAPDDQWMLVDNVVVEDVPAATLVVNPSPASPLITFTGRPITAAWDIQNARVTGNLTITAVNFGGVNAADFSLATPLPLVVGPGAIAPLQITFNPAPPNGMKSASLTIVSDDPQTPSFTIGDLRARRSVGSFLHAHYKLDETSGTTLADSSGSGPNAALTVREAPAYGRPSALGPQDTGTSIGFLPAQTSAAGNYFTSSAVHTPTFSISLWVRPASTGTQRTLFQRDYDSLSPYDKLCGLHLLNDGTLAWRVRSTTIIPGEADPPQVPLADNEPHHIVLTHLDEDGFGNETAARSRIFVNGRLISEKTGADTKGFDDYPLNPVIGSLHVASRTIAGYGYSGDMDDFQVYGVELSREQVWELYQRAGANATRDWAVTSAVRGANDFTVLFPSSPQGSYQLFRSADLVNWSASGEAVTGSADALTTSLVDPAAPAGLQYYRVKRQ